MIDKVTQSRVAVAALLHDIGKFRERAYGGDAKYLGTDARNAVSPDDIPSHALWTYDFFVTDFKALISSSTAEFWKNFPIGNIAALSLGSFNPRSREQKVISLADGYSRGFDRESGKEDDEKDISTPLKSIISSIGKEGRKTAAYYPLGKLTSMDSIIPRESVKLTEADYRKQYDAFIKELKTAVCKVRDWEQLIRKLKDLLLEYTWCIPASTDPKYSDISLYDHSVTTMSIALALLMDENAESNMMRVCAFGISGIQSFIFQSKYASFRNAAKIFRGRSFIVAFFSTAFEKYLCDRLGLIPFFSVMDAGGNITLILPDNEGIEEKLRDCQREIETFLLEKYHATLAIVMDYSLVIPVEEFGVGKYRELRKKIGKSLNRQKSRKFLFALEGGKSLIEEKQLEGGLCPACGKHDRKTNGEDDLCPLCEAQKKLGGLLPDKEDGKYLVLSKTARSGYEILRGWYLSVVDEKGIRPDDSVWTLGKSEDAFPYWRINNYTSGKMFDEMADSSIGKDGRGKRFLSYIKIDVDSLGSIINDGMNESEYSVSRFSTLSRTLHHFFNMHVYGLLSREFPEAYTVLSGGDDLFVILPWNQALDFVLKLNGDFRAFASSNSEIHFSVGIVISKPREPFAFVNERANEALDDEAKKYPGKNAISFFGETFSLNELEEFVADCRTFKSFIASDDNKNGPLTSGFVYRLYQYVQDITAKPEEDDYKKLSDEEKAKVDAAYLARNYTPFAQIHYDIARNIKSNVSNQEECEQAAKFILDRFNNYDSLDDFKMFKLLLIKTMYELRTTENT